MKSLRKYIAVLLVAAGAAASLNAQEFRTSYFMKTSNLRHQMNPALPDSPYISFLFGGLMVHKEMWKPPILSIHIIRMAMTLLPL